MEDGAFNTTFMAGADYAKWVEGGEHAQVADEGSRLPRNAVTRARPAEHCRTRAPGGAALAPPVSCSAGDRYPE